MSVHEIRTGEAGDHEAIVALYRETFPEEDLVPLVKQLLGIGKGVRSFVAVRGRVCIGHVSITRCGVSGNERSVALLGPLVVHPGSQRHGLGGSLVRSAAGAAESDGCEALLVLGDSAYYGRFGFRADHGIRPPYTLPPEWHAAWQAIGLGDEPKPIHGTLKVPEPWRDPSLWLP